MRQGWNITEEHRLGGGQNDVKREHGTALSLLLDKRVGIKCKVTRKNKSERKEDGGEEMNWGGKKDGQRQM
jgi:hypothetical protein